MPDSLTADGSPRYLPQFIIHPCRLGFNLQVTPERGALPVCLPRYGWPADNLRSREQRLHNHTPTQVALLALLALLGYHGYH